VAGRVGVGAGDERPDTGPGARGATTLEVDERDHLFARTQELVAAMLDRNDLTEDDLISIVFTATDDVHSAYPAEAAREAGITHVPAAVHPGAGHRRRHRALHPGPGARLHPPDGPGAAARLPPRRPPAAHRPARVSADPAPWLSEPSDDGSLPRVTVIGAGLVGSSIALAIREAGAGRVVLVDADPGVRERAALGIAERVLPR
jgi:hypothetical protein